MHMRALATVVAGACAAAAPPFKGEIAGDVTLYVRKDGSGNFTSVQAALDHCAPGSNPNLGTVTLHIAGHFFERVNVYSNFSKGVVFIGDGGQSTPQQQHGFASSLRGAAETAFETSVANGRSGFAGAADPMANFIEYNVSGNSGPGTFGSWTLKVDAPNVTFVNVAVANSADGYNKRVAGQSVALHLNADRFACWNCSLLGAQDTLYTGSASMRSYFYGSYINGSVDALFGDSATVFEANHIDMSDTITAQRGDGTTAYLIVDSLVTSPSAVLLGRPWGEQAQVVFKNCYMRGVDPLGWDDWGHNCTKGHSSWCDTVFYAEYNSTGPGADPKGRPWWTHQLNATQAAQWTTQRVLKGWAPTLPAL